MSVSVLVERWIKKNEKVAFENHLSKIIAESIKQPGYLGTDVIHQNYDQGVCYRVLFRYDTQENLKKWEENPRRLEWLEQVKKYTIKASRYTKLSGLETWFAVEAEAPIVPPPRYKMAILSWLAITPLLLLFNYLVTPFMKDLHFVHRVFLSTPFLTLLMTYLLMPNLTKLFFNWLYPKVDL